MGITSLYGSLKSRKKRIWEVDCLRGLAVCMMLASNFCFDLYYFYSLVHPESGWLAWFARATAGLFVFLVGVSLTLSLVGIERVGRKLVRRGLFIFGLGMVISLCTRIAVGENFVVFGILHLIGVGIILSYPFLSFKWLNLLCGILVVAIGVSISGMRVDFPWLLFFGVQYSGFASVDYTPLAPWFGLMLVGIFCGKVVYPQGRPRFAVPAVAGSRPFRWLRFLGQHSLLLYFVHQPVFWAGFWLAGRMGGR